MSPNLPEVRLGSRSLLLTLRSQKKEKKEKEEMGLENISKST